MQILGLILFRVKTFFEILGTNWFKSFRKLSSKTESVLATTRSISRNNIGYFTHFILLFSSHTSQKHQKSYGLLVISEEYRKKPITWNRLINLNSITTNQTLNVVPFCQSLWDFLSMFASCNNLRIIQGVPRTMAKNKTMGQCRDSGLGSCVTPFVNSSK